MIAVKNLTKHFDEVAALDDLTMSVPKGAIYGLVGPNGAGKSTLLRHITGIYRQDAGEVLVDGEKVYENTAVKQRIAYIPDDFYSFGNLHDMQNFYAGLYPSFSRELYRNLLGIFNLKEKATIRRFSKGMQKQAAFVLSLAIRPDVLILDEPVDGLDPVMRRQVWSLVMQEVEQRQVTVLVSSHNLRELEDVCDHVGIMNKGKMLIERSLTDLQDGIVKAQVVFDKKPMEGLDVLHQSGEGRLQTLILHGKRDEIDAQMQKLEPIFYELLPLSLEEIFLYELGGVDYEVKNVLF